MVIGPRIYRVRRPAGPGPLGDTVCGSSFSHLLEAAALETVPWSVHAIGACAFKLK